MNQVLLNTVLPIAKRVRHWTEQKAERAKFNAHNLCGWCAISAAHLFRELKNNGINAELHYAPGHCFVVVDDYVVDVTATQFERFESNEICIMHIKEADQFTFYQSTHIFDTPSELRDHQFKERWPRKQIAYTR